jgi:hypothetical protein
MEPFRAPREAGVFVSDSALERGLSHVGQCSGMTPEPPMVYDVCTG